MLKGQYDRRKNMCAPHTFRSTNPDQSFDGQLGHKWEYLGDARPLRGHELDNKKLAEELKKHDDTRFLQTKEFTPEEFEAIFDAGTWPRLYFKADPELLALRRSQLADERRIERPSPRSRRDQTHIRDLTTDCWIKVKCDLGP